MMSTIIKVSGNPVLVIEEAPLRKCLDGNFRDWMSEKLFQDTPLDAFWYEADGGHLLVQPTQEGRAFRIRAAEGTLTADDWASVSERYHKVLVQARVKYVKSTGQGLEP